MSKSDKLRVQGIRAPRTARNSSEKTEPCGNESLEFATRRYMQRDVEFEVDSTDKSGGFIGALYFQKTENAAIELVREGLATIHSFSAENLSWSRQLYDAEVRPFCNTPDIHLYLIIQAEAKKEKRHVSRFPSRHYSMFYPFTCRSGKIMMRTRKRRQ